MGTPHVEISPREKVEEKLVNGEEMTQGISIFIGTGEEELNLAELYLHQDVRVPSSATSCPP